MAAKSAVSRIEAVLKEKPLEESDAPEKPKDAPIIVLDEATAFADAENEHQIQLAFERMTRGKTVLMIAHRLSTIQDADMILVFGDGKIVERGDHNTLLKQNGVYASMWNEYQTQITWKVGKPQRKEANHD